MNVTWMLKKKIVENSAETVPQPSQKVHWAQLFSLPFSHEFQVQNSIHVQANDITPQDSNVWLLQNLPPRCGSGTEEARTFRGQLSALTRSSTCVFTVCLTDHYRAFKRNSSCCLRSPVQISHFTPLGLARSLNVPGLHGAGPERGSRPPHTINMSSC